MEVSDFLKAGPFSGSQEPAHQSLLINVKTLLPGRGAWTSANFTGPAKTWPDFPGFPHEAEVTPPGLQGSARRAAGDEEFPA